MNDERLDQLIDAHLNGGMTEEERRELEERLLHSAADRVRFWELAETHTLLAEALQRKLAAAGAEGEGASRIAPLLRRWSPSPRLRVGWAACAAALAAGVMVVLPLLGEKADRRLMIASHQGEVEIVREGHRRPAGLGGLLQPGERLRTGADGRAELRLADGTSIRMAGSTDVALPVEGDSRVLQVKTGVVRCEVAKQPAGRPLVFQTPHAELTVLGTAFDLLAAPIESRVQVEEGRVHWTNGGPGVEVDAGEASTADYQGLQTWVPVCDLDFTALRRLPPQLETVFCDTASLHAGQRKIVAAPQGVALGEGGLRFAAQRETFGDHGLIVTRWIESIGGDVAIEVAVTAEKKWSLQMAVDGDSFDGYRIIFAAPRYPNGIAVDSFHPSGVTLLAQDPRTLPEHGEHTLRVEKRGSQVRVWVDRELRIDTVLGHGLAPGRNQTFALAQFGVGPLVRSLKVWKAAPQ